MSNADPELDDDLWPEYDFSEAAEGKLFRAHQRGTNVALLLAMPGAEELELEIPRFEDLARLS